MPNDGNQVAVLILACSGALVLGLFLPREEGVPLKLFIAGLIALVCGTALSSLRGIPLFDLLLLKDISQFGKMIPIGYALILGSLIALTRHGLFSEKRNRPLNKGGLKGPG